jgi:hypothetical protein
MSGGDDIRARVRQLLLSGDNTIKNRDNPERFDRARQRFRAARALVVAHDLGDELLAIIDARLEALPPQDGLASGDSPSQ